MIGERDAYFLLSWDDILRLGKTSYDGRKYYLRIKGDTIRGQPGSPGEKGDPGDPGEKGDPGVGMTWQGPWSAVVSYVVGDAVESGGNGYVCLIDNINQEPPNANWSLFASKGADGEAGPKGDDGDPGPKGDTGAKGDPGEKGDKGDKGDPGAGVVTGGSTGQVLKKKSGTDYDTEWDDESGGSGDITKDELASATTNTDIDSGKYVVITAPGTPNTIEKITKASLITLFATDVGAAIDGAGELTTLASDDKIAVWDESASALKYITEANRRLQDNPIGTVKIYDNTTSDPNTLIGGTWERTSVGKFMVGYDSTDTAFDTALETGGAKTINLAHTHTVTPPSYAPIGTISSRAVGGGTTDSQLSAAQSILPPYMVFCVWRRTA